MVGLSIHLSFNPALLHQAEQLLQKTLKVSFPSSHTYLKCQSQAICPSVD
jgi:hypothetical protein